MHINSDRLTELLTEVECLHIENCTQCKVERQKLMALKVSVNQLDLIQPPEQVWQDIKYRHSMNQKNTQKKSFHIKPYVFASAASIFFVSAMWLMWSNYHLQGQLKEILLVNAMLEQEIVTQSKPTFKQAIFVDQLRSLDSKLFDANTNETKLSLLEKRQLIIKQYIKSIGEDNHAYSS
jgi:hypothetical protein